jgi:hypothetical protein
MSVSDELVRLQPEVAAHLSRVHNTLDKQSATWETKLDEIRHLVQGLANGQLQISFAGPVTAKFQGLDSTPEALSGALPARPAAQMEAERQTDPGASAAPSLPGEGAPPVYTLMKAKTVEDVWREWDLGIAGGPAVKDLERVWGHRWRPIGPCRVAFARRKVVLDELAKLRARGRTPAAAVAELEALRGSRSIRGLWELLVARNKEE